MKRRLATALAAFVSGYPAMVKQVLQELSATTGVDVTGTLARSSSSAEIKS